MKMCIRRIPQNVNRLQISMSQDILDFLKKRESVDIIGIKTLQKRNVRLHIYPERSTKVFGGDFYKLIREELKSGEFESDKIKENDIVLIYKHPAGEYYLEYISQNEEIRYQGLLKHKNVEEFSVCDTDDFSKDFLTEINSVRKCYLENFIRDWINPFNPKIETEREVYAQILKCPIEEDEGRNEGGDQLVVLDIFTEEIIAENYRCFIDESDITKDLISYQYSFMAYLPNEKREELLPYADNESFVRVLLSRQDGCKGILMLSIASADSFVQDMTEIPFFAEAYIKWDKKGLKVTREQKMELFEIRDKIQEILE